MMDEKVTYHQQVSFCGKPECKRCRRGTGHGPYWYAYQMVDGQTKRTYVGKHLPPTAPFQQTPLEKEQQALLSSKSQGDRTRVRVYTLGQLRIERLNGNQWRPAHEPAFYNQHVRALLSALLSSPTHILTRDQLQTLWPSSDSMAASRNLDHAVHRLRQLLDPTQERTANTPLLRTDRTTIILAEPPLIWIDADAFETHYTQASTYLDSYEGKQHLEEALTLYSGKFLPDEPASQLLLTRRQQLRRWLNDLLLEAVHLRIRRGHISDAVHLLKRLLASEPGHEVAVQTLMQLLVQSNQLAEAILVYRTLQDFLQKYETSPLPQTHALYEEIQRVDVPVQPIGVNMRHVGEDISHLDLSDSTCIGRERELRVFVALLTEIERIVQFTPSAQMKSEVRVFGLQALPQTLFLLGEVGIGKTRLAEEMRCVAALRHWNAMSTRSHPGDAYAMYLLWTPILRHLLAASDIRNEMMNQVEVYGPLSALMPELEMTFSSTKTIPYPLNTEREHLAVCEAVCNLILFASRQNPQFLLIENIHNADYRSIEMFAYLVRKIRGYPIILVTTIRNREIEGEFRTLRATLQREQVVTELSLETLTNAQIHLIVSSKYPSLSEQDVLTIVTQAAGIPLFADVLAQNVQQEEKSALPDVIKAVFEQQVGRVSVSCRQLLSRIAVVEESFAFPLAQRIEPGQDEERTLELIEEALHMRLLVEEGLGRNIHYHFWHPLLPRYLAASVSEARRNWLNRCLSDAV